LKRRLSGTIPLMWSQLVRDLLLQWGLRLQCEWRQWPSSAGSILKLHSHLAFTPNAIEPWVLYTQVSWSLRILWQSTANG
jgi:hypothetical protein